MTTERNSRPKPQYGEYADPSTEPQAQTAGEAPADTMAEPENAGNRKPSFGVAAQDWARGEDQPRAEPGSEQSSASQPTPAVVSGQPTAPQRANFAGPLPGVPHNLGAKGQSGQSVQPAPQTAGAATPSVSHQQAPTSNNAAAGPAGPVPIQARPRSTDRIVTIILLVVGSYFALSMALTLSQFTLEFSRVADQLGVKDFTAPPILKTLGTIGAILVLAIYALVLIFSIRRLRARKVTFWAPLVSGVLAWVLFFVLFFIGLNQSAELWQALLSIASDPAAAQQMIERLNSKG